MAGVGDNVLVGAPLEDTGVPEAGAAYLLDGDTGVLLQTFRSPNPALGDSFGWSVAGVGGNVLVGAPFDDTEGRDAGAAYLFDGVTGALLQTFLNPTPGRGDFFGWSLAAMGENIVVGAPEDSAGADRAGAAYLFAVKDRGGDTDGVP